VTANTNICYCGDEPAIGVDAWNGEPVGEWCAARTRVGSVTAQDVNSALCDAVTPDDPGDYREIQSDAIERLASLLVYQQQRIANLEATVAKLTKGDS
jgi:hypothetical protein